MRLWNGVRERVHKYLFVRPEVDSIYIELMQDVIIVVNILRCARKIEVRSYTFECLLFISDPKILRHDLAICGFDVEGN